MIEKMKFVNIMGPVDDVERVKELYLKDCEIQLEDAVQEIGQTSRVSRFVSVNRYADILKKAEAFAALAGIDAAQESFLSKDDALKIVNEIDSLLKETENKIGELTLRKSHLLDLIKEISPFIDIEFPIDKLIDFHFIKYRFGKIPVNSFRQFEAYLDDKEGVLLEKSGMDKDFVYCVYFVPEPLFEKFHMIFSSLHFEDIELSSELNGTPFGAYCRLNEELKALEGKIADLEAEQAKKLIDYSADLPYALRKLKELSSYSDMQRYAAKTHDDFYVIVGWMAERDARRLEKKSESDEKVVVIIEENVSDIRSEPPTKLKNFPLFKPFESLIKLYGLPKYGEIDPTAFFAVSYSVLFGLMFGDLGQGLVMSLAGLALYRAYNVKLGAVLAVIGMSSAFFGVLYGSVFGYEDLIPSLWVSPMHSINTVLAATLAFGVLLNLTAMVIHIVNGVKRKAWGSVFFDASGISGLVFYSAVIVAGICAYTEYYFVTAWLAFLFMGLPLLLIMFREPLTNKLAGSKRLIHGKKSDFITELIFETFEIVLSYITNTVSFIRVGAFALCHAGMMSVVLMLAGAENGGRGNLVVMIFGNLFVMLLEGLIVGIQALRLQFYEMFSRYFTGGGREFQSFNSYYKL